MPQLFAMGICRSYLPWEFAAAICCDFFLWVCFVYVSKLFFCVIKFFFFENSSYLIKSKPFWYVSKTFFIYENFFINSNSFCYCRGSYGPPYKMEFTTDFSQYPIANCLSGKGLSITDVYVLKPKMCNCVNITV